MPKTLSPVFAFFTVFVVLQAAAKAPHESTDTYRRSARPCAQQMGDRIRHAGLCGGVSAGFYRRRDPRHSGVLAADRLLVWRHRPDPACPMLPQDRRVGAAPTKYARWSSMKASTFGIGQHGTAYARRHAVDGRISGKQEDAAALTKGRGSEAGSVISASIHVTPGSRPAGATDPPSATAPRERGETAMVGTPACDNSFSSSPPIFPVAPNTVT